MQIPSLMACVSFSTLCNPHSFHPSLFSKTSPFNQYISLKPTTSNSPTLIVATTLANADLVVDEKPKFRWVEIRPNSKQLSEDQKFSISKLPKNMTKRSKAFVRQIICYSTENGTLWDLVASWVRLMKPVRSDWLVVLKELSDLDHPLFPQVFECALSEDSFEPNVRDYTKMIHFYAKKNNLQDAEYTISSMTQKGMICDQVTLTTMIHMYSKAGNFNKVKEIFDEMQLLGHPLDKRSYGSMVMAYIRAGMLEKGEALVLEMEADEIYPGKEVYKALLRAYSMKGDYEGSQRVFNAIQLSGTFPDDKQCALLINAYVVAGKSRKACIAFENMRIAGVEPSDKCVALLLEVYEKENNLNAALDLLINLEKDGTMIGKEASQLLTQWFRRIGVIEEVALILQDYADK